MTERADMWRRQSGAIGVLFLIFTGLYFFDLANFPLSIDEELAAIRSNPSAWISQGRWGAYVVELLLPRPAIPFLPLAFFGLCASISYCVLLDVIHRDERLTTIDYLLFGIFAGYPVWFFITEFYSNLVPVGAGLLATALATWCLLREERLFPSAPNALAAIALGAFAIGTYQSFVAVFAVMICGMLLIQVQLGSSKRPWVRSTALAFLWLLAVVLYAVTDQLFRFLPHPPSAYFDSLWKPGALISDPAQVFVNIGDAMSGAFGFSGQFSYPLWTAPILLLGIWAALTEAKGRGFSTLAFSIVAVLALLCLPFALGLTGEGRVPIRALIGVPIALWVFSKLAFQQRSGAVMRGIAGAAILVLLWQTLVIANRYQAIEYFSTRRDAQIAASLGERILTLPGYDPTKTYYLVMYGAYQFPVRDSLPRSTTIGSSFFGWDGGNPRRVSAYMSLLGYPSFKDPPPEVEARYLPTLARMPVFPSPGSVVLDHDTILLRLSAEPSSQDLSIPGWSN